MHFAALIRCTPVNKSPYFRIYSTFCFKPCNLPIWPILTPGCSWFRMHWIIDLVSSIRKGSWMPWSIYLVSIRELEISSIQKLSFLKIGLLSQQFFSTLSIWELWTHKHTHLRTHMHTHAHTHTHTHTHTHSQVHTHSHRHLETLTHTHTQSAHPPTHISRVDPSHFPVTGSGGRAKTKGN